MSGFDRVAHDHAKANDVPRGMDLRGLTTFPVPCANP